MPPPVSGPNAPRAGGLASHPLTDLPGAATPPLAGSPTTTAATTTPSPALALSGSPLLAAGLAPRAARASAAGQGGTAQPLPPRAALPQAWADHGVATPAHPLHDAVRAGDLARIASLVALRDPSGKPAKLLGQLDEQRLSPLHLLDILDLPADTKAPLRDALLTSHNPTAPAGYTKPSTLHGSPWGLEILSSGAIKGGVNAAKGGAQSLEGQVFFSDRTPVNAQATTTRPNLRTKARSYAQGGSFSPAGAANRLDHYKAAKALLERAQLNPAALTAPGPERRVALQAQQTPAEAISATAWQTIEKAANNQMPATLTTVCQTLALPEPVVLVHPDGTQHPVPGSELRAAYLQALQGMVNELEAGKAPFLGVLNSAEAKPVVPVVFGFEEIKGLSSHTIVRGTSRQEYSYQNAAHPLGGAHNGGKLKEIELQSLQDLATLMLGALAKGTDLPDGVVVRLKARGSQAAPAQFLSPEQVSAFKHQLLQSLATASNSHAQDQAQAQAHAEGHAPTLLADLPLAELQAINQRLRADPALLSRWASQAPNPPA